MKDDGFTLLEILVVTVVFGLLSVALWEGIGVGTHGWAMAEHRHDDEMDGQGIEDALRRLIERADIPDNGGAGRFSGQGDRLRVIAWLPEKNGYEKEVEAAFGVDAHHELVVRWQPYRRANCPEQAEALHEEILARGISAIDFSYYGLQGGRHVWQPTWNSPYLPLLVRIQVRFLAPGRNWPTMMIRPLLSGAEAR